MASSPAIARPAGVVRSSASVRGNETHSEVLQFLEKSRQQIGLPSGPSGPVASIPGRYRSPRPASGLHQFLAGFPPRSPEFALADLQCAIVQPRRIAYSAWRGSASHEELVAGRSSGLQAGPEHFPLPVCLAKKRWRILASQKKLVLRTRGCCAHPGHTGWFLASGYACKARTGDYAGTQQCGSNSSSRVMGCDAMPDSNVLKPSERVHLHQFTGGDETTQHRCGLPPRSIS